MAVDYRKLNKLTKANRWPIPRVDDVFDQVKGGKVFSSLDLTAAYHHITLQPSDVEKTAFITPMGLYEFLVLPFGLSNAPSVFASVMHRVLKKYIGDFVVLYLDDILIFSDSDEQHAEHIRLILHELKQNHLYVNAAKCRFFQQEIKFLGHIISAEGVAVNKVKVQAVEEWPKPTSSKEVQRFLGLANYFRRFVQGFSSLAAPLTALAPRNLKHTHFAANWTPAVQRSFDGIKHALTHAPVLAHPNPNLPFHVFTDASVNGTGGVLLQCDRPIAYFSHKFGKAEHNYATGEQEMLGVVLALIEWRCYLEGCKAGFVIDTDHEPLIFLDKLEMLSRKKARWLELLSRFNFTWNHIPGRDNVADPLSRRPDFEQALRTEAFRVERLPLNHPARAKNITEMIQLAYEQDTWFHQPRNMAKLHARDGLWYRKDHTRGAPKDQVAVPNDQFIKARILADLHDSKFAGHRGFDATVELITRVYWWPRMRADIAQYIKSCESCQRNKAPTQSKYGLLHPLPVPSSPFESVSMDFITGLPKIGTHDSILVVVDRLSKYTMLFPCATTITAQQVATLYASQVVANHGWPKSVVSDRDKLFTSSFWQNLHSLWEVDLKMSTAYHPQTDGQTERMNRVLEETLRHFVSERQKNWSCLLPMAQFAINNSWKSSTNTTPFLLVHGRNPYIPLYGSREMPGADPDAVSFAESMESARVVAQKAMQSAQDRHRRYANRTRRLIRITPGSLVLLSTKHLKYSPGHARKLLPRFVGPYEVLSTIDKGTDPVETVALKLQLPAHWRIHDTFHVSLVKPFVAGETAAPPSADSVFNGDDAPPFEIDSLEDHRKSGPHMEYWVRWMNSDNFLTWEREEKIQAYYPEMVASYWRQRTAPAGYSPARKAQVELAPAGPKRSERIRKRQDLLLQHEADTQAQIPPPPGGEDPSFDPPHPGGGESVTRETGAPAT